jgi:quinol monooxygenase YgiN
MTVKVTFELNMQEGKTEAMIDIAREAFQTTRKYDWCKQIDISVGQDDPTLVIMTEEWESKEKHQAYVQFRTEDGTIGKIGELLAGPPKMSYYDLTDA